MLVRRGQWVTNEKTLIDRAGLRSMDKILTGLAPDPDMMVEMVPVDYAAAAIAHIVLNGPAVRGGGAGKPSAPSL